MPNSCVLSAWLFDGNGSGTLLTGDSISKEVRDDNLAWVHLDAGHPGTRDWLHREVGYLDELILDALLAEETRPRILEFNEGALVILRGVNLNEGAQPEDMVSIRFWIDPHRIVSLRLRPLKAVRDIEARLKQGKGPKNAGDFLTQLSAHLFERMEPALAALDEATDDIEEKIMEHPDASERRTIIDIRKQAIIFRRYISPQRDVMQYLRTSELPLQIGRAHV